MRVDLRRCAWRNGLKFNQLILAPSQRGLSIFLVMLFSPLYRDLTGSNESDKRVMIAQQAGMLFKTVQLFTEKKEIFI